MRLLVIALAFAITGCSTTVPVKQRFPDAPAELLKACERLKLIEGTNVSIIDMLKVVVENYQLYWECEAKVGGWQDWYKTQRQIFDK